MRKYAPVIIIGTNHHNTLSMVRCFGISGIYSYVIVYGEKSCVIESSMYVRHFYYELTLKDSIVRLKTICEYEDIKPVVLTCTDEISSAMDKRYDEFKTICYFFNAGMQGRVTEFMDKQKQIQVAKTCGFTVPYSFNELPNRINIKNVNYPCFVKPKESINGGKHISICNCENELKEALIDYDLRYDVLVQDFIPKEYEVVILGYTYNNETYIPGFIRKHREFRGATTYATVYPIKKLPVNLIDSCVKMVEFIGYTGLWGIECIKNGDDYYFIELNMRNDATTYALTVAGCNLPLHYYNSCIDESEKINDQICTINSMVEYDDFNFVLKRQVPFYQWIKEYYHSKCKYYHNQIDKKPHKKKRNEYIKFLFNRLIQI